MVSATIDNDVEAGAVGKIMHGRWSEINRLDTVSLAHDLANFIPGAMGGMVSAGLAATEGRLGGEAARLELEKVLRMDLASNRYESRAAGEWLDGESGRTGRAVGESVAGTVGATAIGAVGTMLFPGVGLIARGAIGIGSAVLGSVGAQKLFEYAVGHQEDTTLDLIAKLTLAQRSGAEDIPATAVFAAIAAGMEPRLRKAMEKKLSRYTDGRASSFAEAVTLGEDAALERLMKEYNEHIQYHTGLTQIDPVYEGKTASEVFAHLINTRRLDARALMFAGDELQALETTLHGKGLATAGVEFAENLDGVDTPSQPAYSASHARPSRRPAR